MKIKRLLFAALAAAMSLALCACGLSLFGTVYNVDETRTHAPDGIAMISVSDISCSITVQSGGDTISAQLSGTCAGTSGPINLQMEAQDALVSIVVDYPEGTHDTDCTLTITLPAQYEGSLTIKNVSGNINADALTSPLAAIAVDTVSANCTFVGIDVGRIQYTGVSGDLSVDGTVQNGLVFNTTSGNVDIHGLSGNANIGSISGNTQLTFEQAGDITVGTTSGNVQLYLPSETGFSLDFDSVSGKLDSDFSITLDQANKNALSGTVGDGGVRISIATVSGDASIFRR